MSDNLRLLGLDVNVGFCFLLTVIAMNTHNLKVYSVGHILPNPTWRMKAHSHPFHELIAPVRGIIHVIIQGRAHAFGPGTILLYPPGVTHEEWSDLDALESYFVSFRWPHLCENTLLSAEDPEGRIRQLLRWLFQDRMTLKPGGEEIRLDFVRIILALFQQSRQPLENEWVQKVRDYIRHHLQNPLTLTELAQEAGLSRFHFVREYQKLTGRTPMADARFIRADFARELILTTNLPLKEIAPAAGLGNEYSLSRVFRRLFKMPPGEFRRNRNRREMRAAAGGKNSLQRSSEALVVGAQERRFASDGRKNRSG
jgi:AraC-like DNA-binding protein